MSCRQLCVLIVLSTCILSSNAELRLPKLVSHGMVLQRNMPLKIWGWANKGEYVQVSFQNQTFKSVSDNEGEWTVELPAMQAGGPYIMTISTHKQSLVINDILIGEVWLCSGQSNMQFVMQKVKTKYAEDIANCTNNRIRSYEVPKKYVLDTVAIDMDGGEWVSTNPKSIQNYSAVAYFFGLELYKKYQVPIGLINSSVGGTPAQAWMSEEAIKRFPHYYEEAQKCKNHDYLIDIEKKNKQGLAQWRSQATRNDKGLGKICWCEKDFDSSSWPKMELPGYWNQTKLKNTRGVVWFRRKLNIPQDMLGGDMQLILGRIVNSDSVYINGKLIGSTSHQYAIRKYTVPEEVLHAGENTITIRVVNERWQGGFVKGSQMALVREGKEIDLSGQWHYLLGVSMPALPRPIMLQCKPTGLYNKMIAPIRKYAIKGVIWYQGEGNVNAAKEYADLFPALIRDWRYQFNNDSMPFLYVQLANFMKVEKQPKPSDWALLRESQMKTLDLENTGMAVTIDIGEWNDIHPLNKKDVGKRLAVSAQKMAYGEAVVHAGPLYRSMRVKNNRVILSFDVFGSELAINEGRELQEFTIAGEDKKFVWAKARIINDKVEVWSDEVEKPVAVRYAWANNPDKANFHNSEGLPASPFRTDDWEN